MQATVLTGQSIYANTITGASSIATPLMQATVLTGQSIYANTITGASSIATPLMQATVLTSQSIYANTITGASSIATPFLQASRLTSQSIYANTITGASSIATPFLQASRLTSQSIYANAITGSSIYYNNSTNTQALTNNPVLWKNIDTNLISTDTGFYYKDATLTVGAVNTTSDYRIKSNVEPIASNVDSLNPVSYYNNLSNKTDLGFIAHELQEYFPMLVTGEKDGPVNQSINYAGLIPVLVSEVQELKAQMKDLKQQLKDLHLTN